MSLHHDRRIQGSFQDFVGRQQWHMPHAVTLTFKKGRAVDGGKGIGIQHLTPAEASETIKHFLNYLNRHMFGNMANRFGTRVQAIPVIEWGAEKGIHCHLILDCPRDEYREGYAELIGKLWGKTDWGHKKVHVHADCDAGWTKYVSKLRDKPDYGDSIDWANCHVQN